MAVAGEMQVTTVRVVGALAVMRFVRTHAVHKIIFTLRCAMCFMTYSV